MFKVMCLRREDLNAISKPHFKRVYTFVLVSLLLIYLVFQIIDSVLFLFR